MLSNTSAYACLGAALLGVFSHLALFIRGEWHMQAPILFKIYTALPLVIFLVGRCLGANTMTSIQTTLLVVSSYGTALFTSIVIYRKFFHRLRHFPGPWMAGATKFWHAWQCRKGKNFLVLEELHKKYGPVIRTGPEELTIIDAAGPAAIDGPRNKCNRAVWYDTLSLQTTLNLTRNMKEHDKRRRIWEKGFTTKALDDYQGRVIEYAELLASQIERLAREGSPVNVSDWFYWLTFDVMGEFAFARSFGMLRGGDWHFAVRLLRRAMGFLGIFGPVPWTAQISFSIAPWMHVVKDWVGMAQWSEDRMNERIANDVPRQDVFHWLIEASREKGSLEADLDWLKGDAVSIIIAGSDTIAPTLIFAFFELARNPQYQDLLLSELGDINIYDKAQLETCSYLTAIINETMRLYPALPTGGYRQSPPDGMTINDVYIPGDVTIISPRYSLGRLESSYECADQFIPERWTTRPEMIKDARGFAPFSQGRFSCVGKNLAMGEMRFVIALLVKKFKIEFWGSEKGEKLFADLRDQLTAAPGRLDLQFQVRE